MALVITDEQNYSDIAGAIRLKLDVETTFTPSEMAAAIESISGGGDYTLLSEEDGLAIIDALFA